MNNLPEDIISLFRRARSLPRNRRLGFFASGFVGYPYHLFPLGEGIEKPRFDFSRFDCLTFVEEMLALTLSDSVDEVLPTLDRVRYKDGVVSFLARNHFPSIDWIPNNSHLFRDITENFEHTFIEKWIDRKTFFEEHGYRYDGGNPVFARVSVVSPDAIPRRLPAPLVVFFAKDNPKTIFTHAGLVIEEKGELLLYNASSEKRAVVRERVSDYIGCKRDILGVKLLFLSSCCEDSG